MRDWVGGREWGTARAWGARIGGAAVIAVSLGLVAVVMAKPDPAPSRWRAPAEYVAAQQSPAPTAGRGSARRDEAEDPKAVFIGDSDVGWVTSTQTFPEWSCSSLHWRCRINARGGSGYVQGEGLEYIERLHQREDPSVDYVVVAGGRNDLGTEYEDELAAVRDFMATLRLAYPEATVFVLEPFWLNSQPPQEMTDVRRAVREGAESIEATWIPTQGWFTPALLDSRQTRLTSPGHAAVGRLLARALSEHLDEEDER